MSSLAPCSLARPPCFSAGTDRSFLLVQCMSHNERTGELLDAAIFAGRHAVSGYGHWSPVVVGRSSSPPPEGQLLVHGNGTPNEAKLSDHGDGTLTAVTTTLSVFSKIECACAAMSLY